MIERRRLLIVEDEPLIAMMLEDFLDALDYKAAAVVDTTAAAPAKVAAREIDATILDVNLRGGERCWPIADALAEAERRSDAHTSELQSLSRTSHATICLKTNKS